MGKDITKIELGGLDLTQFGIRAVQDGITIELPPLKGEDRQIPGITGRLWVPKDPDGRKVALRILVSGLTPSSKDGVTLQGRLDQLRKVLTANGPQLLRLYMADGSIREGKAEVVSAVEFQPQGPWAYAAVVELYMADPWFYDPNLQTSQISTTSVPYTWLVNNPGTVRAENLVITITATATNPTLGMADNSVWFRYRGNTSNAQSLVIDVKNFKATVGGLDVSRNIEHWGDVYWLFLEPGDNTLKFDAASLSGTATVKIDWNPPYA